MSVMRKMLLDVNRCTYQMIQQELNIGSALIHICRWVSHNLTEHSKEERVSESVNNPLRYPSNYVRKLDLKKKHSYHQLK
ncbi:UNVERIFIED_CONTAM: hypothetical protein NCL1_06452 [Trichonephila clavipes]